MNTAHYTYYKVCYKDRNNVSCSIKIFGSGYFDACRRASEIRKGSYFHAYMLPDDEYSTYLRVGSYIQKRSDRFPWGSN